MATPEPVLAQAAGLLSPQIARRAERLAKVVQPHAPAITRNFLRRVGGRLDARQKRALSAVTVGAAAELLAAQGTLADFIEQVEYNGRRLAKLDLPPGIAVSALRTYTELLQPVLARAPESERQALREVCEQLNLAVVLTLSNAFYQVREAETQAFYDLGRAELEAGSERDLLQRVLAVLTEFCRAREARLYVFAGNRGTELAAAVPPKRAFAVAAEPSRFDAARYLERNRRSGKLVLDPAWRARFESFWSVPLRDGGRTVGLVQFAFPKPYEWLPREARLLAGAAEHCLLAWEKQRLTAQLADRERQLRDLAAHVLEVEENERRRIGRELHDETGQVLLYLRLKLDMLGNAAPPALEPGFTEARDLIDSMVLGIRRLIADLSPAVLESAGLGAAVRQLVARLRRSCGIPVHLRMTRIGALPERSQLLIYRVLQECCSNIARHSSASAVMISLSMTDERMRLLVEDNGAGFDAELAFRKNGSFGLAGMRERVSLAGGRLAVTSRPGQGARIEVELPLLSDQPERPEEPRRTEQSKLCRRSE